MTSVLIKKEDIEKEKYRGEGYVKIETGAMQLQATEPQRL